MKLPRMPRSTRPFSTDRDDSITPSKYGQPIARLAFALPWLILAVLTFIILGIYFHPIFKIATIECVYFNNSSCPPEVEAELAQSLDQHALFFSKAEVIQKLSSAIPQARDIGMNIKLPNTLQVEFSPHTLIANVKTTPESPALIISETQAILEIVDSANPELITILYPEAHTQSVGEQVTDTALAFSLNLIAVLRANYIPFDLIEITNAEEIIVTLDQSNQVIFSANVDVTRQVHSLQLILAKAKIEDSKRIIDVRFDQPVLKSNL